GGLYSHWGGALRFSSSDNSDPRTNGRGYAVVQHPQPVRLLILPLLLLILLLNLRRLRRSSDDLPEIRFLKRMFRSRIFWYPITISLGLYIVGWYVSMSADIPIIEFDSTTYWRSSTLVPIGYPVFLRSIYTLFGSLQAVVAVQILLF